MKTFTNTFVFIAAALAMMSVAAPKNGTIEMAALQAKGDSLIAYVPIDYGQLLPDVAGSKLLDLGRGNWYIVVAYDNNIKDGKFDVPFKVVGAASLTAEQNYVSVKFPKKSGYKYIQFTAYQMVNGSKIFFWVNNGERGSGAPSFEQVPKDPAGVKDPNTNGSFYRFSLETVNPATTELGQAW